VFPELKCVASTTSDLKNPCSPPLSVRSCCSYGQQWEYQLLPNQRLGEDCQYVPWRPRGWRQFLTTSGFTTWQTETVDVTQSQTLWRSLTVSGATHY